MPARERLEFDILARDVNTRRTLDGIADSAEDVEAHFDSLGDETNHLDIEINRLEASVQALTQAFKATGDVELLRAVKRDQSSLKFLRSMRGEVEDLKSAFGALFSRAIASPLAPAIAAAVVAGAPIIGASLNAALLAGLGAGGLGLGIASAIRQDNTIKQEFTRLGHEFVDVFDDMGERFVQPMRGAARFFRTELAASRDDWVEAIGGLDDLVESGARGMAGFFKSMSPGAMKGLEATEQVLDKLFEKLPGLGEDVSTMFESFAQGGDGAVEAMEFLVDTIGNVAVVTGEVVEVLSKAFDLWTDFADAVERTPAGPFATGILGPFLDQVDSGGAKIKAASDGFDDLGDAAADVEVDVRGLNRAMDDLLSKFLTLDELEMRVAAGFDELRESVGENGKSLDVNSEKGRANREVLLDQIDALKDQRQANIEGGMTIGYANKLYNDQYAALLKLATSLGISKKALLELLGPYNQLQSKTVTLTFRQVFTSAGEAQMPIGIRGGRAFMQQGGPVGGGTPAGVDAQLRLLASDEWVVRGQAARAIGPAGMHAINQADRTPAAVTGGMDMTQFAHTLRRVLSGMTLQIDDRTGRTANLYARGG